jgi:hypothetical protein
MQVARGTDGARLVSARCGMLAEFETTARASTRMQGVTNFPDMANDMYVNARVGKVSAFDQTGGAIAADFFGIAVEKAAPVILGGNVTDPTERISFDLPVEDQPVSLSLQAQLNDIRASIAALAGSSDVDPGDLVPNFQNNL